MLTNVKIGDLFQLRNGDVVEYLGEYYNHCGIESFTMKWQDEERYDDWFVTGQNCGHLWAPNSSIISDKDIVKKLWFA